MMRSSDAPVGWPVKNSHDTAVAAFATDLDDLEPIIDYGLWYWAAGSREVAFSHQLLKMLGHREADARLRLGGAVAMIHPDDRRSTLAKLEGVLRHRQACEHEFRIIGADGAPKVCWSKMRPIIEGETVVAVRGTCLDVTYLRKTEAQARETQEDYRHIIELSPQKPWVADSSGNILSMGARWTAITGLPTDEALGTGWMKAVHPNDLDAVASMLRDAEERQPLIDGRYRLRTADGSYRWMRTRGYPRKDANGQIIRWYGLTEDIQEQVEAEQSLREGEEHYRHAVELSPQIPWTSDPSGNITEVGPRWLELMGMDLESTLGQGWAKALHPEDVPPTYAIWSNCLETGAPLDIRYRLKHVDGEYRWVRARARPRRDATGQIVRWYGVAEDIHDQVRAEDALSKAEERYRLATQATNDLIWDWDVATARVEWTRSLVEGFGYPIEELGTHLDWWGEHIHPDDRAATLQSFHEAVDGTIQKYLAEYRFRRADGSYATVCDRAFIVRDEQGRAIRAVGAMQDLSEHKRAEAEVRWGATHDYLTELPNRRLFQERLEQALACAAETNCSVGLLHLDVDQFKQINDALGHGAGDTLLRTLASRLRGVIRPGDTVARLGGDEFAIILPQLGGEQDLTDLVGRLLERMREPFAYDGRVLDCRASIGASLYPEHGSTPEELLKNADIALYMAKAVNRAGFVIYEHRMREEIRKRATMVTRAREAIRENRLIAYYQPKVDLQRQNRIVGFEALLRWQDLQHGIQLPMTLEAAFEDLEVAADISDRIIAHAITDMRRWLDQGIDFGHVAVNAAAAEFRRDDFAERVLQKLAEAQVPTSCFQLEVTETVFLGRGAEYVDRALKLLSSHGVQIALDDFGTGYASLRHLKQFPVNIIKIDQSFVRGMMEDPEDEAIIRAVVGLGRSLGISVVAEGVETAAQHDGLRAIGCSFGQGFLYSRAVCPSAVPALLGSHLQDRALSHVA
jgi:diguanylate cyclase (GGDEF)-like protein/PAS domain S-box-containing protein